MENNTILTKEEKKQVENNHFSYLIYKNKN